MQGSSSSMSSLEPNSSKGNEPKITIAFNKSLLWDALVELVTVNGRPLSIVSNTGMNMVLEPIIRALNEQHPDKWRAVNRKNLNLAVAEEAYRTRELIRSEVRGRLISIKLDVATLRSARSMLGVNIQFCREGRLILRNIAVEELFDRHTGLNLRQAVLDILQRYAISPSQIYSATTDNASNMLNFISTMNAAAISDGAPPPWAGDDNFEINEEDEDECNDGEYWALAAPAEAPQDTPEWAEEIDYVSSTSTVVTSQRCAAHTLQLAVSDALKKTDEAKPLISKAKLLSTKLRVQTLSALLRRLKKRRPSLDCDPRWNSLFDMFLDLLALQDDMDKLVEEDRKLSNYNLSDTEWALLKGITEALAPAKEATVQLQSEQLVVGDFIKIWYKCKMKTKKIGSPLALALVQAMETRQEVLLSSPCIASALYLDPRFQCLLTSSTRNVAVTHLKGVWTRLRQLRIEEGASNLNSKSDPTPSGTAALQAEDEHTDMMETYLREREAAVLREIDLEKNLALEDVTGILRSFWGVRRLPPKTDVLAYWELQKSFRPELYELAMVALGVPVTQVSVERTFSNLQFVVSALRSKLGYSTINDIMIVRCNRLFGALKPQ